MIKTKLHSVLQEIGLTQNESIVYLTLLNIGQSTTGEILNKSQLNSGRIYEILYSLQIKGLVNRTNINNVKYFDASDPKDILKFLKEKKIQIDNYKKDVKNILPELRNIKKSYKEDGKALVYTGYRGIRNAIYEILDNMNKNDILRGMGWDGRKSETYNSLFLAWNRLRSKKNIKAKIIFSENISSYYKGQMKIINNKIKILNKITPSAINIYGQKYLLLYEYNTPSVVVINNKDIIRSNISMFEGLWKISN